MAEQQMSEEQLKALQEKIKQMSPEELKEFQKKQCIFCQIVSGNVQSKKVYEDEHVLAILDINPSNPGHLLVMPKEHYSIMPQIPNEEIEHIFLAVKMLSNASLRALEVQGSNVLVANGVTAGQRAQHFMVHLIPRKDNDNLVFELPQKTIPEKQLLEIAEKLAKNLGSRHEKKEPVQIPQIPKQKEIIEAEFDESAPGKKPASEEPEKKTIKSMPKTKNPPKKNDIDLDDIAKMFGAK